MRGLSASILLEYPCLESEDEGQQKLRLYGREDWTCEPGGTWSGTSDSFNSKNDIDEEITSEDMKNHKIKDFEFCS